MPSFRTSIIRGTLTWVMLSLCALWASDAKNAKARAILDKADELSALATKGSPSFTLRAKVAYQYEGARGANNANLLLQWADDEHWRATVDNGQRKEVYIRNAEGMWLPKLPDPVLFPALAYGMTLVLKPDLMRWDEELKGVRQQSIQGTTFSCALLRRKMVEQEVCVDPATSLPRWTSNKYPGTLCFFENCGQPAAITEYRDYSKFGAKWLPGEVVIMLNGRLASNLQIVGVEFSTSLPAELFANPPQGEYEVWPACNHYRPVQILSGPIHVLRGLSMGPADGVLIVVRPGAKTPEARLVRPSGHNPAEWLNIFTDLRYQAATCDGSPVLGYTFLPLRDNGLPYGEFTVPLRY